MVEKTKRFDKPKKFCASWRKALNKQPKDEPLSPHRPQEEIAGDVLRRPRVAQFKQNRHSPAMDCIRSAFERSANTITPPLFAQPRYRMAG